MITFRGISLKKETIEIYEILEPRTVKRENYDTSSFLKQQNEKIEPAEATPPKTKSTRKDAKSQRDNKDDEVTPKEIEKDEVVKTEEQGDGAKTKETEMTEAKKEILKEDDTLRDTKSIGKKGKKK
ncbi:hypothetical protein CRE_16473 [Caenorhabditis remanei]|uniref:Uncharacterized protein n=1 Tax=Caenorhabditis remanei TaxID=31234 RepID=E3NIS5_CAERE|nr:hypothetical protein CRE_16473 [Caenorhabditis remanei]